jgi:hypothetical protein
MYGGNSRSNATIAVTDKNASLNTSQTYSIDGSSDAMLLLLPNVNSNISSFSFSYYASGTEYNWW